MTNILYLLALVSGYGVAAFASTDFRISVVCLFVSLFCLLLASKRENR